MIASIIFILAFWVRVYNLPLFPLNHDEATWSLRSVDNFDKFLGIPVACFHGYIQPFFSYLVIFSKRIFSSPEYIVRIPSAAVGAGTAVLVYMLAKDMYGKRAGFISSLLLCFLPWHVIQSRIGVSLILAPFFGCLFFYALFKAIQTKSNIYFILSCVFLSIGSFYTYQVSVLFIPIFITVILWIRKDLYWLKPRIILFAVLIFLIFLYPLIYLETTGRVNFLENFYRTYHVSPFKGNIFLNIVRNLRNNTLIAIESLFIASRGRILYGAALQSALMIIWPSFIIILLSMVISFLRRKVSDKIFLIWLILGFLGTFSGVSGFAPRHIIIFLPPLLIFIGKFIGGIFDPSVKPASFKYLSWFFTALLLFIGLVFTEIFQLQRYYTIAPFDLEECRRNSYGCKEAVQYLAKISDIKRCNIIPDVRMTIVAYVKCLDDKSGLEGLAQNNGKTTYYVLWAPESHPEDYWGGLFRGKYNCFKQRYPNKAPLKVIYYPNGLAAINIFKVKDNEG